MSEGTIWDGWAPPTTRNEFSREAAESIIGHAGTVRHLIARCIAVNYPLAAWQLENALGYSGNTIRPRLRELEEAGIILRRGEAVTPSGRRCGTYVITELGRRLLA